MRKELTKKKIRFEDYDLLELVKESLESVDPETAKFMGVKCIQLLKRDAGIE